MQRSPPGAPSWLLANTACVVPPSQIHIQSPCQCSRHQQEGERQQRAHFLYVQPAQWNRKCLDLQECEGKIKWSLHPIKCSFFPLFPLSCLSFSITLSVRARPVSVYFLFMFFSKRTKHIQFSYSQISQLLWIVFFPFWDKVFVLEFSDACCLNLQHAKGENVVISVKVEQYIVVSTFTPCVRRPWRALLLSPW